MESKQYTLWIKPKNEGWHVEEIASAGWKLKDVLDKIYPQPEEWAILEIGLRPF